MIAARPIAFVEKVLLKKKARLRNKYHAEALASAIQRSAPTIKETPMSSSTLKALGDITQQLAGRLGDRMSARGAALVTVLALASASGMAQEAGPTGEVDNRAASAQPMTPDQVKSAGRMLFGIGGAVLTKLTGGSNTTAGVVGVLSAALGGEAAENMASKAAAAKNAATSKLTEIRNAVSNAGSGSLNRDLPLSSRAPATSALLASQMAFYDQGAGKPLGPELRNRMEALSLNYAASTLLMAQAAQRYEVAEADAVTQPGNTAAKAAFTKATAELTASQQNFQSRLQAVSNAVVTLGTPNPLITSSSSYAVDGFKALVEEIGRGSAMASDLAVSEGLQARANAMRGELGASAVKTSLNDLSRAAPAQGQVMSDHERALSGIKLQSNSRHAPK